MTLAWLLMGMFIYKAYNEDYYCGDGTTIVYCDGYDYADAFYFSVQAGLSIGFGSLAETSDGSRIYSCVHVVLGGLVASTVMSTLIDSFLSVDADLADEVEEERTAALVELQRSGKLKDLSGKEAALIKAETCYNKKIYYSYTDYFKTKKGTFLKATLAFIVWAGGGVAYAMTDAGLNAAEAFEFAISAITTGGLMGFSNRPTGSNNMGVGPAMFAAIYSLLGVPLYGFWLGAWIGVLLDEDTSAQAVLEAREQLDGGVDDTVTRFYISKVMPLIYPTQEEGGFITTQMRAVKIERLKEDNPSLVDALIIASIEEERFGPTLERSVKYLEAFHSGWSRTVGERLKDTDAGGNPALSHLKKGISEEREAMLHRCFSEKAKDKDSEGGKTVIKVEPGAAQLGHQQYEQVRYGCKFLCIDCGWSETVINGIKYITSNLYLSILVIAGWLINGMCWYKFCNIGLSWADAFYFSVQAGYSIGFGSLSETSDGSRWFSCVHMVLGGLVAATAVSTFLNNLLDVDRSFKAQIQEEQLMALIKAREQGKLEMGMLSEKQRAMIIEKTKTENVVVEEARHYLQTKRGQFLLSTFLMASWSTGGALFAYYDQEMSWPECWEFAISAVTTGGLMGLNKRSWEENSLGTGPALFAGIYGMFGVPLFGYWLGCWINVLQDQKSSDEAIEDVEDEFGEKSQDDQEDYDKVSLYYTDKIMPYLYPDPTAGGMLTKKKLQIKAQRCRDGNPSLVDALFICALEDKRFGPTIERQTEYIKSFNEAWKATAGHRHLHDTTIDDACDEDAVLDSLIYDNESTKDLFL